MLATNHSSQTKRIIRCWRYNPLTPRAGVDGWTELGPITANIIDNVPTGAQRLSMWPRLIALPDGSLRCYYLWRERRGASCIVQCSESRDGGDTWKLISGNCLGSFFYDTRSRGQNDDIRIVRLAVGRNGLDQFTLLVGVEFLGTGNKNDGTNYTATEVWHSGDGGFTFRSTGYLTGRHDSGIVDQADWNLAYSLWPVVMGTADHTVIVAARHNDDESATGASYGNATSGSLNTSPTGSADVSVWRFASTADRPSDAFQKVPMLFNGTRFAQCRVNSRQVNSAMLFGTVDDTDRCLVYGKSNGGGHMYSDNSGISWSPGSRDTWSNYLGGSPLGAGTVGAENFYQEVPFASASACFYQGRVVVACNNTDLGDGTAPFHLPGSLNVLTLGGWSNVNWPLEKADSWSSRQLQVSSSHFGPFHPSGTYETTLSNGTAPQITFSGSSTIFTPIAGAVYSASFVLGYGASTAFPLTDTIISQSIGNSLADIFVNCVFSGTNGGASTPYTLRLHQKTTGAAAQSTYDLQLRIISQSAGNILRLRDQCAASNITSVAMPAGRDSYMEIMANMHHDGKYAVFWRKYENGPEKIFQLLASGTLTDGSSGKRDRRDSGILNVNHILEDGASTLLRTCHIGIASASIGGDPTNTVYQNFTQVTGSWADLRAVRDHRGAPLSGLRSTYVANGVRISAAGGLANVGETWKLITRGEDPLGALTPDYSKSPQVGWKGRAGNTSNVRLAWHWLPDGGQRGFDTDTWGIMLKGINFPDFSVDIASGSGPTWTEIAKFSAAKPVHWVRTGKTIRPSHDGANASLPAFRVNADELMSGTFTTQPLASSNSTAFCKKIERNTSGYWSHNNPATMFDTTLTAQADEFSNVDQNAGTGSIWYPQIVGLIHGMRARNATGISLRLNPDGRGIKDGYLKIDKVIMGPLHRLGYPFKMQSDLTAISLTENRDNQDGTRALVRVLPTRRVVQLQGQDIKVSEARGEARDDYMTAYDGATTPDSSVFGAPLDLFSTLAQQQKLGQPIVWLPKIPRVLNVASQSMIHEYCSGALYGSIVGDLTLQQISGREFENEVVRFPSLRIEEEI